MAKGKKTRAPRLDAPGTPDIDTTNTMQPLDRGFAWAVSFEWAANQCWSRLRNLIQAGSKASPELFAYCAPFFANSAFATELYIKTLIFQATGTTPWGHNLGDLYQAVPLTLKHRVERQYRDLWNASGQKFKPAKPGELDLKDLGAVLDNMGEAFADVRYGLEDLKLDFFHGPINAAFRQVLIDINPAWAKYAADLGM